MLLIAVLVGVGAGVLIAPLGSSANVERSAGRSYLASVGDDVRFAGLPWRCFVREQSDPAGIAVIKMANRLQVFCRYEANNGGCPFLIMAAPYLWLGDASAPPKFRATGSGAVYLRTNYGCG